MHSKGGWYLSMWKEFDAWGGSSVVASTYSGAAFTMYVAGHVSIRFDMTDRIDTAGQRSCIALFSDVPRVDWKSELRSTGPLSLMFRVGSFEAETRACGGFFGYLPRPSKNTAAGAPFWALGDLFSVMAGSTRVAPRFCQPFRCAEIDPQISQSINTQPSWIHARLSTTSG